MAALQRHRGKAKQREIRCRNARLKTSDKLKVTAQVAETTHCFSVKVDLAPKLSEILLAAQLPGEGEEFGSFTEVKLLRHDSPDLLPANLVPVHKIGIYLPIFFTCMKRKWLHVNCFESGWL